MKFRIFAVLISLLMTFALATSAMAGSIDDADSDLTPDVFDNCTLVANGTAPGGTCSNQIDSDDDGFGDPCDTDFNNDGVTAFSDFLELIAAVGTTNPVIDVDCDGVVAFADFQRLIGNVGQPPGPAGAL